MELDEAKRILGMIAGRKSGVTTVTLNRDAARVILDHLAEQGETEWEYGNEQLLHSHVEVFAASSEAVARAQAWLYPIRRRRKAGPWLPAPGTTGAEGGPNAEG